MKLTRTIYVNATITIECCRDGVSAYVPAPQEFHKMLSVTKDKFREDLIDWRNRIIEKYEKDLRKRAKDECLLVGTRNLCIFKADWTRTIVEETKECAEADIVLYKEIQKRLFGYKKQIDKLEKRRDQLRKIKERTDAEIDELRDIIRRLERLLKIESGDIDQLNRLKERCPGIEEYE